MEEQIKSVFPKLLTDYDFKITSPITSNYNCIAWAYHCTDRWMWPGGKELKILDGFHFWPDGVDDDVSLDSFVEAFKLKGYEVCFSWEHENGFRKIALYVKDGNCTHASRELVGTNDKRGKWTSKMGKSYDIQHGNPYTIEGELYGDVACIMKQLFP